MKYIWTSDMTWLEKFKKIAKTPIKIPLHSRDATTTSPASLYQSLLTPLSSEHETMHGIHANEFGETGIKVNIDDYEKETVVEIVDAAIAIALQRSIKHKRVEAYFVAPKQGIRMWGVKIVIAEFHDGLMEKSKAIETLARRALRSKGVSLSEMYWRYSPKAKTPHDVIADINQEKKTYPCPTNQSMAGASSNDKKESPEKYHVAGKYQLGSTKKATEFEKTRPMIRQLAPHIAINQK